ncbi:MAG: amidohydrolase [Enterococcus avium]
MTQYFVFKSTNIFTGTQKGFLNGYVVFQGQRITGVYPVNELPKLIEQQATVVDYHDNTIVPGFIEAHTHVQMSALIFNDRIQTIAGESEEECISQLSKQIPKAKFINGWLVAKGWYLPHWKSQKMPTKSSLDAYFKSYPVMLISDDLHTIWVNSIGLAALEELLVIRPEDVIKIANEPSGVVKEKTAMACMNHVLTMPIQQRARIYSSYLKHLAEKGYTSVCDLALLPAEDTADCDDQIYPEVYQKLEETNQLPVRVFLFPFFDPAAQRVKKLRQQVASALISVAGGKQFFDGVISSQTAWLKENYENADHAGKPTIEPMLLKQMIDLAQKEQIPLRIHSIGDQATRLAIRYFLEAHKNHGPLTTGYHSLEHLERIQKQDIGAMKKAGLIASVQPSHPLLDYQKVSNDLGERSKYMWPLRDISTQGIPLAFGSDSPVVQEVGPLDNLYYAMTRQTKEEKPKGGWQPEQQLDLYEALFAHTRGASKACGSQERIGTLEAGKQADLVIVEGDLSNSSANKIYQLSILATIVNGQITYKKEEGKHYVKGASNF